MEDGSDICVAFESSVLVMLHLFIRNENQDFKLALISAGNKELLQTY
jgi:hypothetical protein